MPTLLSKEKVVNKLKEYDLDWIEGISQYTHSIDPITVVDKKGYFLCVRLRHLKAGFSPIKFGKSNPHTIKNISTWCKENNKSFYILEKQGFKGNKSKLLFHCEKCGLDFKNTWGGISSGKGCHYCSNQKICVYTSLFTKRPDLIKFLKNKEEAHNIFPKSTKKVETKCPECGYERFISTSVLNYRGFSCPQCSGGMSTPQKFCREVLVSLNINFISEKRFTWAKNKRYDFFIPSLNMIIETHGIQHYIENKRGVSLQQQQENDILKERLAKENGIENYIVIDCRYSTFEWLLNNFKRELIDYFDLNSINWDNIWEGSQSSLLLKICRRWESREKHENTRHIAKEMKLHRSTIIKYLKIGAKMNKCTYTTWKEDKNDKR